MYCDKCGKEIAEGGGFCAGCGAPVGAGAATAPPPAGPAMSPPVGPPAQPLPYAPAPPPKKPVLPWVLGILGVAAIVALVLVLVLVVFKGDDNKVDTSGPEQVVLDFFEALEKQDVELLLSTIDPEMVDMLEEALGEDYVDLVEEYFFMAFPDDLEVDIDEMETEIDGDEATVVITEGTMSYTDEYGDEVTEEAADNDMEAFELIELDGEWYLSAGFLEEMGFDPEEFEGLDDYDFDTGGDTGYGQDSPEMYELISSMQGYAYENSAEGLVLSVISIAVNGDEAVGIERCYNQELEDPFVVMEKGASGWKGVDFGTGIELPAWYEDEMAGLEEAVLDYVYSYDYSGEVYEVTNLYVWGDEAACVAVCTTNPNLDSLSVVMFKSYGEWYGEEISTDMVMPDWYWSGP